MSIRNLEKLFKPVSIALIGASKRPGSVVAVLAKNLFRGGFNGPVMPVNPKHCSIQGILAHQTVESLPLVPDLSMIATPPTIVPGIIIEAITDARRFVSVERSAARMKPVVVKAGLHCLPFFVIRSCLLAAN